MTTRRAKLRPKTVPVRLPVELAARVARMAAERGCFQKRILEEALGAYLPKDITR